MKKKIIHLFLISITFCCSINGQGNRVSDTLYVTQYFSFHNNMWMNLHHFMYELASNRQSAKLREDSLQFNDLGDSLAISNLLQNQKDILNIGVQFYKDNIIDQPLLNSGRIFKWFQAQPNNQNILDTTYSKGFTKTLNQLRPLYETHFWSQHQNENYKLLNNYVNLIEKTEDDVIKKMEILSGSKWNQKVRVDLTTYGNWASAYSPALDNIVVCSIDPLMNSTLFIEFVFHESSHLLFLRDSPFRRSIFTQAKSLEIKYPRQLWHAAMFYLSGLATKEALDQNGYSHELIMQKKNVFGRYFNNELFKSVLINYYNQEIDIEEMSLRLLKLE